jgi:hypothetical protein
MIKEGNTPLYPLLIEGKVSPFDPLSPPLLRGELKGGEGDFNNDI